MYLHNGSTEVFGGNDSVTPTDEVAPKSSSNFKQSRPFLGITWTALNKLSYEKQRLLRRGDAVD